jgi:hypothetical protein
MKIEISDLGYWGSAELRSEYDPQGPVIRVNARVLERLPEEERAAFVARAIAHEYYHHLEHCGKIPVIADRAARERAASSFTPSLPQGPSIPQDDKIPQDDNEIPQDDNVE